jgi:hypothetical protein
MPPAGFELVIPAIARPQTHALDRAATGIVWLVFLPEYYLGNQISESGMDETSGACEGEEKRIPEFWYEKLKGGRHF